MEVQLPKKHKTEDEHFKNYGSSIFPLPERKAPEISGSWGNRNKIMNALPCSEPATTIPIAELAKADDDERLDDDEKFADVDKTDRAGNNGDADDDEDLDGTTDDDGMVDPENFDEDADDDDY